MQADRAIVNFLSSAGWGEVVTGAFFAGTGLPRWPWVQVLFPEIKLCAYGFDTQSTLIQDIRGVRMDGYSQFKTVAVLTSGQMAKIRFQLVKIEKQVKLRT